MKNHTDAPESGAEMEMNMRSSGKFSEKINNGIAALDKAPLWWTGLVLAAVFFYPIMVLGEGSVFPCHDQLDESLMLYVLNGRHMLEGLSIFPEMMGGITVDGVEASALLFVPLYRFLPTFFAYLIQYAAVSLTGFFGMYFCVKEITESSILSMLMAGCFFMLPLYPIYGLSVWGIPMVLYAFLKLYQQKHIVRQLILLAYFAWTSHLAYTGYAVIALYAIAVFWLWIRKRPVKWVAAGWLELFLFYAFINRNLIREFFFGVGDYVSHRTEMVNSSMPFFRTIRDVFFNSAQHAPSCHKYLILPIIVLLIGEGIFQKDFEKKEKNRYFSAVFLFLFLIGISVFYGICKSAPVVAFKNSTEGILHSYQMERFYWLYPALWYLEFGVVFSLWWNHEPIGRAGRVFNLCNGRLSKLLILLLLLFPTIHEITYQSVFYMNVNQINNGSEVTGYIPWESYYAEDLMQELEDAIGREMSDYRIGHLGICPAPALKHGFYTIDGYSSNYSLEYKHRFRKVIAAELEKAPETKTYFDTWGCRCYLLNGATGNLWMLGKQDEIVYEDLDFDMEALKELDCEYLFSCGEIRNAEELGLEFMGYYETKTSYWGVWLYQVL